MEWALWHVILVAALTLSGGFAVGMAIRQQREKGKVAEAEARAQTIRREAEQEARTIRKEAELEAKETQLRSKESFEKESQEKQREFAQVEKRLQQKEDNLDKRIAVVDKKEEEVTRSEQSLVDRKQNVEGLEKKYNELVGEVRRQLEQVAGVSAEEAKRQLREAMIDDARQDAARSILEIEEQLKEDATKKSQLILSTAMERMASDYVAERAITVVPLPGDEMKGRIIGREGRNIRALEAATGIDIVIDDTPEAVILSGFNPVRREVARITLERLIADGRIHPTRIEEMVAKVTKEVDASIKEAGEQLCLELNATNVHPELVKLLGSLKYRYSFAQNVYQHTREVAFIAGMMAAELGLSETKARRAGLLHDVGKAVSHEVEGSHALIGMEYAKKYREDPDVVHAIGAHHEDLEQTSALDLIVDAADALSGARPGARREVLEAYVKRIEDLERISTSFKGVEKAYAIQAGREIRVMVMNEHVSDAESVVLSREIAKKIEQEMKYPGQIKVTVIRETRATEYAK